MELKAVLFLQYSRLALTRRLLGSAAFAAAAGFAGAQSPAAAAPQETVLYSFTGGTDGGFPAAGLILGEKHALYGTTAVGGTSGQGSTVFRLTPPATGQTQWTETVLHSFTGGNDGGTPRAGLIFGGKHVLYGTRRQEGLQAKARCSGNNDGSPHGFSREGSGGSKYLRAGRLAWLGYEPVNTGKTWDPGASFVRLPPSWPGLTAESQEQCDLVLINFSLSAFAR